MVEVLRARFFLNLIKVFAQIRVSVGKTMCEINTIIIVVKGVSKSECIVAFVGETVSMHLVSNLVLVITDILSHSMPAYLFVL